MTDISSAKTGNWSAADTWNPAQVPVDGDRVWVNSEHTVTFDVDQSGFPNGMQRVEINGTMRFKTDANTVLKMNELIVGGGYLYVGNSPEDRIQAAYTAKIQLRSGKWCEISHVIAYGAVRPWASKLAANAPSGTNTLVFDDDLALAADEEILITSTDPGDRASNKIIQSYTPGTKTAILTTNLTQNHYIGDYVAVGTRNIIIENVDTWKDALIKYRAEGPFEYVLFRDSAWGCIQAVANTIFRYCVFDNDGQGGIREPYNCQFYYCVAQNCGEGGHRLGWNSLFVGCYFLNNNWGGTHEGTLNRYYGCLFANTANDGIGPSFASTFVNCIIQYNYHIGIVLGYGQVLADCVFTGHPWADVHRTHTAKFSRCKFNSATKVYMDPTYAARAESHQAIFHDFDQVAGDHRVYMKGGMAYRETSIIKNGPASLKLECASSTYRVFHHLLKAAFKNGVQRSISFYIRKTVSMAWLPRVYLIRSGLNPIEFPDLSPLATFTMPNDNNDSWEAVTGTYTHTADEVLEFIAVAKHDAGYVYFADPVVM